MSITYNHVQLSFVDNNGNVKVFYPKTTGSDVTIDRSNNSNIPSDVTTIQDLSNKLAKVSFSNSYTDLSNKPTLGTASAKDVPSSGNASTSQVVMGNDTRLSDSRNAKDVYSWAKAATKPTYTASEVGLGNVGNFKAVSTVASQGLTDTEKSNARSNIGAGTSSLTIGTTSSTAAAGNHTHTSINTQTLSAVKDANTSGENGKFTVDEFIAGSSQNLPNTSNAFTVMTSKNSDGTKAFQIAGSSTSHYAYFRNYADGTGWSSWYSMRDTNTQNTAGSTDTSSKIFLIGATSQAANPQTYSDDEVYATSGVLSSKKVSTKAIVALTGSGTAGSDKGSGVSPRYIPSLWTFNAGVTVANGEVYFIKIPVAGGTYGVWLSLNNGTNYYPVAISTGKGRFTTHYAANSVIAVTYESAGVCTCYAKAGADTTADVTGIFRVLNDYDANTTYSAMSASELTTGTVTSSRVVRSDYLKSGITTIVNSLAAPKPTTLSATLAANATSVSFTNAAISTSAMIDVYTSVPNLNYTNMTISGTTLTLTYPKQSAAVTVKLVIST